MGTYAVPLIRGHHYNQDTFLVPKGVHIIGIPLCSVMHDTQTHTADSEFPDQMVSEAPVSRGDYSQAPPSIVRFVQLIIPILLTFTLYRVF